MKNKTNENIDRMAGFACAGGHHKQNAVLPLCDRFNGGVDSIALVVAGLLAAAIIEVRLKDELLLLGEQSLPSSILAPQYARARKLIQGEVGFQLGAAAGAVVEQKSVTVGCEHKRDIECRGVVQRLLHAIAHAAVIVLGLDESNGDALIVEDVIGSLRLAPRDQLASDNYATLGEADLATNLCGIIPPGLYDRRGDVLGADVGFAERLLGRHISRPSSVGIVKEPLKLAPAFKGSVIIECASFDLATSFRHSILDPLFRWLYAIAVSRIALSEVHSVSVQKGYRKHFLALLAAF